MSKIACVGSVILPEQRVPAVLQLQEAVAGTWLVAVGVYRPPQSSSRQRHHPCRLPSYPMPFILDWQNRFSSTNSLLRQLQQLPLRSTSAPPAWPARAPRDRRFRATSNEQRANQRAPLAQSRRACQGRPRRRSNSVLRCLLLCCKRTENKWRC